ncbi:MAG: diacylglycerol kinase [Pseudorhodoplanes sp.]
MSENAGERARSPGGHWIVRQVRGASANSWNGLRAVFRSEAAFRLELLILAIAIPLAFVVGAGGWQRLLLIACVVMVLVVELLNTAIEKVADRVTLQQDPAIRIAKDAGSAAVGLSLALAGAIWLFALAERLLGF